MDTSMFNSMNELEETKFKILLEKYLEPILSKKYQINQRNDVVSREELIKYVKENLDTFKKNYLQNRKPNTAYSLEDVAYLPYESKYYLRCVEIDNSINNGRTSADELIGFPPEICDNPDITEPLNHTFADGGIIWKICDKFNIITNDQDVIVKTKLISCEDIKIKGEHNLVDGTLIMGYDDKNSTTAGENAKHLIRLADVEPAVKTISEPEAYSKGIAVGSDAVICNTNRANYVGIRGNKTEFPVKKGIDEDKGGIAFGAWANTGVSGNKSDLILETANGGAVLPYYTTDELGNQSTVRGTSIGAPTIKFDTIYVKRVITDDVQTTALSYSPSDTTASAKVDAYPTSAESYPITGFDVKSKRLYYNENIKYNAANKTLYADLKGTAEVAGKVSVTNSDNTFMYIAGVTKDELNKSKVYYDSNISISATAGIIKAIKFDGIANKIAVTQSNTRRGYLLGNPYITTDTTPIYDSEIYIDSEPGTLVAPNIKGTVTNAIKDDLDNEIKTTYIKSMTVDDRNNLIAVRGDNSTSNVCILKDELVRSSKRNVSDDPKVYLTGVSSNNIENNTGVSNLKYDEFIYIDSTSGKLVTTNINSTNGDITNLTTANLTATNTSIETETVDTSTIKDAIITNGNINTLVSNKGTISTLSSTTGKIEDLTVNNLVVKNATFESSSQKSIIDTIYPVGSIYISILNTDPSTLFANTTWSPVESGRFLMTPTAVYSAGSMGGSNNMTLTMNHMPAHTHEVTITESGNHTHTKGTMNITGTIPVNTGVVSSGNNETPSGAFFTSAEDVVNNTSSSTSSVYAGDIVTFDASKTWEGETSVSGIHTHTITEQTKGANKAFSILPPFLAVYMWIRIE